MQRVKKSGKHPQGWTFPTEGDIADMVRAELGARGIVCIPTLLDHGEVGMGQTQRGAPITRHTVRLKFTLSDGKDSLEAEWVGQADDSSDKGLPKAITAARKSFLISAFLISSGDEPDAHEVTPAASPPSKRQARWEALKAIGEPLSEQDIMAVLKSIGVYQSSALESDEKFKEAEEAVAGARDALEPPKGRNPGPIGDQTLGRADG